MSAGRPARESDDKRDHPAPAQHAEDDPLVARQLNGALATAGMTGDEDRGDDHRNHRRGRRDNEQ
jgi:hypothetical protein